MGAESTSASGSPSWLIEELSSNHDRSAFSCGQPSLDDYIRQYAGQNQKSGFSRTYVAVFRGENVVRGYYSLAAGSMRWDSMSEDLRKKLPKYPVPVAHLGRLAVDHSARGRGLGEDMLYDAFARVCRLEHSIGIHAIEVVAIDDAAKRFYLKHGFTGLADDPLHMCIPLKVVRTLGLP